MRSWALDRSVLRVALRGLARDLEAAADQVQGATPEKWRPDDQVAFAELLSVYVRLMDLQRELRDSIDLLNPHLIAGVPDRFTPVPLPGGGVFRIRGGSSKTVYDNERLVSEFAHRIGEHTRLKSIVTDDGEVGDPAPILEAIVQTVAKATGAMAPSFNSWRTTVAKDLGIDLKRFSTKEATDLKPTIEGRSPQPAED